MDKKKLILIGVAVVGVVIVVSLISGGGSNSSDTQTAAVTVVGGMAGAVASNNAAAYQYMIAAAEADASTRNTAIAYGQMGISDALSSSAQALASMMASTQEASSLRNSSVAAVEIANIRSETDLGIANYNYLLGSQYLDNQRALIGLQLPLAKIEADTTIALAVEATRHDTTMATIEADRDVAQSRIAATTDQVVNEAWANATIQQAYYQWKAIKTQVEGVGGALGWGNLILGKSAAFQYGPIKAATGTSSNNGGGTQATV